MRKYDIFGKRISQVKFIYSLVLVFLIAIAGYFGVIRVQENRLYELETEERNIQRRINQLLNTTEPLNYQSIEELLPFLPTSFDQYIISNDLIAVRNATGFQSIQSYQMTFSDQALSPFSFNLPQNLKFVRISVTIEVTEPLKLLDYIEELYLKDKLYHIQQVNVSMTNTGAIAQIVLFTFYHQLA